MEPAEVGRFSAVGRFAGLSPVAPRAGLRAPVGARCRYLLELQWRGSGGRFRHFAVRPPRLRRVMASLGVFVLLGFVFGVARAFTAETDRPLAHVGLGAILRERACLNARHAALRERAFDLAEQLYARVEQGRRMVLRAGAAGESWTDHCPRPPARDAEDEAIFAWLAGQGMRLEAIGGELTAGRVEMGVRQAAILVPVSTRTAPERNAGVIAIADSGSGRGVAAAPAKR